MITEEQRRALFALREALHLCEAAEIHVDAHRENVLIEPHESQWAYKLQPGDIDTILAENPEEEPEPVPHGFIVGQVLRCIRVPNRHDGYFTPGGRYEVDAVDTSDTFLPLLMNCDEPLTLWCEASAFEAVKQ